jgi:hypothetical protein
MVSLGSSDLESGWHAPMILDRTNASLYRDSNS